MGMYLGAPCMVWIACGHKIPCGPPMRASLHYWASDICTWAHTHSLRESWLARRFYFICFSFFFPLWGSVYVGLWIKYIKENWDKSLSCLIQLYRAIDFGSQQDVDEVTGITQSHSCPAPPFRPQSMAPCIIL